MTPNDVAVHAQKVIDDLSKLEIKSTNKFSSDKLGKTKAALGDAVNRVKPKDWDAVHWGRDREISIQLETHRTKRDDEDRNTVKDTLKSLMSSKVGNCGEKAVYVYAAMRRALGLQNHNNKCEWTVRLCSLTTADHAFAIVAKKDVVETLEKVNAPKGIRVGTLFSKGFCPLILDGWTEDWWFWYPSDLGDNAAKVKYGIKQHRAPLGSNAAYVAEKLHARKLIKNGALEFDLMLNAARGSVFDGSLGSDGNVGTDMTSNPLAMASLKNQNEERKQNLQRRNNPMFAFLAAASPETQDTIVPDEDPFDWDDDFETNWSDDTAKKNWEDKYNAKADTTPMKTSK